MRVEQGGCDNQTGGSPKLKEMRKDPLESLRREHGPADTLILDFWPVTLGEQISGVLGHPPLWWGWEAQVALQGRVCQGIQLWFAHPPSKALSSQPQRPSLRLVKAPSGLFGTFQSFQVTNGIDIVSIFTVL